MSDLTGNSVIRRVGSMTPGARIGMAAGSGLTTAAGQFFLSRGKRESGPGTVKLVSDAANSPSMGTLPSHYRGYRFPLELISYAVWLYHRFCLSFRDVEELLAERGVSVSYEAVRQWCLKFGSSFTKELRHRRGRPGDTWYLDEVFVTIQGKRHYLWRAVDQDGEVLDILVQKRRDQRAAKRFFRKLLKGLHYVPRLLVTDRLGSYGVARRELLPSVAYWQDRHLNNRAEVSHQPTRQRERQMRRFKSPGQAQRFLSAHDPINNLFRCGRHLMRAAHYRVFREQAFATWREVTGLLQAA
jgi:putative transposase